MHGDRRMWTIHNPFMDCEFIFSLGSDVDDTEAAAACGGGLSRYSVYKTKAGYRGRGG